MELTQETAKLIMYLEAIIGEDCYNPNSYDGYTDEVGRGFRYPVYMQEKEDDKESKKMKYDRQDVFYENSFLWNFYLNPDFDPHQIYTLKYKFGSNHLYIGEGLVDALNALERRYGLDFNKLEQEYLEKHKK